MSDIECPYCEKFIEEPSDSWECAAGEPYEHECPECGKTFQYVVEYWPSITCSKADCLNGAPHDWQKICGFPEEHFVNKRRCSMCGEERTFKPEELEEMSK